MIQRASSKCMHIITGRKFNWYNSSINQFDNVGQEALQY